MSDVRAKLRLHDRIARVMADERFSDGRHRGHELRSFIVAYYWARYESDDRETVWQRTKDLAGMTNPKREAWLPKHRLQELYRADAPRYEPDDLNYRPGCPALLLRGPRTGEPCGRSAAQSFKVTDPATGEWAIRGWCSRHADDGQRAYRYEQRKNVTVEPTPNVGGLLPCYIAANNWIDIYEAARHGWKAPSIGIRADDWPVLARVAAHERPAERPAFSMLDGGGEDTDDAIVPDLRLVVS